MNGPWFLEYAKKVFQKNEVKLDSKTRLILFQLFTGKQMPNISF